LQRLQPIIVNSAMTSVAVKNQSIEFITEAGVSSL